MHLNTKDCTVSKLHSSVEFTNVTKKGLGDYSINTLILKGSLFDKLKLRVFTGE